MNCVNLVITGNPGVGKHTIADLFVKQDSSYQIFDINKFAIEKGFGEKNHDEIEVDTTKLKSEIGKLNFEKSIIVGHLAPYVLDESNIDFVNKISQLSYLLYQTANNPPTDIDEFNKILKIIINLLYSRSISKNFNPILFTSLLTSQ